MKFTKWYILVFLFILNIFLWYAIASESPDGKLRIYFLDVGQGDAIFIEAPNKNQVLIDGGSTNGKLARELGKVMPFYDRSIDTVIATHPDKDHIGGLVDIFPKYNIGLLMVSGAESESKIYEEFNKRSEEIERVIAKRGMRIVMDDGIYLNILFPDREASGLESNTASIVAQLIYGESEFLLMGDSPKSIEKYLLGIDNLESDVLKVGHHGSNTSTDILFLGLVMPEIAIISAGEGNQYGHPHPEVIDLLNKFEIEILSTSEQGTITLESDGRDIVIK